MKKIIISIFVISLLSVSCEFDEGYAEMNVNPRAAASIDPSYKLASVILKTSGSRYENWRSSFIHSSCLIQHQAATWWEGNFYQSNNQDWANALFNYAYPNQVKEVEDLRNQLIVDEDATGSRMGMTRIMRVFIYHRLTDFFGDIPYSEAGQGYITGNLTPVYDPQQDIYTDMLKELDEAIPQITANDFGAGDILYHGDISKWKKFGYSLMLRLAMRLTKADIAMAETYAKKAITGGTFTSNDDLAKVDHTAGPEGINKNGHGEVFSADGAVRLHETFVDYLKDHNDPRLPILAARRSDKSTDPADLFGMPSGLGAAAIEAKYGVETDYYAEPNRAVVAGEDTPMVFQSYAEVEFLKAEAAIRGWHSGDAATHYANGVTAAMEMLGMLYPNATIASDDISAYLAANPYDAANGMEMIHTQFWVSSYLNEYEAFANWRRTGFPTLTPFGKEDPFPGNMSNGTIPRRLLYPNNEASVNPDNFAAVLARQGPNEITTRVWWDK